MALAILVDGLAGRPETTFGSLKDELEQGGHRVVLIDTSRVVTHEDRVQLVLNCYNNSMDEEVFFIGLSAGGSAVQVAAERIGKSEHLEGAILLSPAMPRGVFFMTRPLGWLILARLKNLLMDTTIVPTAEEYEELVSPLPEELREEILGARQPISSKEAFILTVRPPKLGKYHCPTLLIYGSEDRWITPQSYWELFRRIRAQGQAINIHEVAGAGHLVLASHKRSEVIETILDWIAWG